MRLDAAIEMTNSSLTPVHPRVHQHLVKSGYKWKANYEPVVHPDRSPKATRSDVKPPAGRFGYYEHPVSGHKITIDEMGNIQPVEEPKPTGARGSKQSSNAGMKFGGPGSGNSTNHPAHQGLHEALTNSGYRISKTDSTPDKTVYYHSTGATAWADSKGNWGVRDKGMTPEAHGNGVDELTNHLEDPERQYAAQGVNAGGPGSGNRSNHPGKGGAKTIGDIKRKQAMGRQKVDEDFKHYRPGFTKLAWNVKGADDAA